MSVESTVAGAALNQTKEVVDALIKPTIEKIARWSFDRDLRKQLAPDRVERVTKRYLERLLTLASGIQSVVFPQVRLLLHETYEPLVLETVPLSGKKSETLNASALIARRGHFTIVDRAGMGKSTFSKYLTTQACELTDQIPILYNLRLYQAAEPLTKALLREFHEFDKEFGEDLFNKLLVSGKFFIILDGFDEVTAQFQSDVRKEIEFFAVKCGGSRIVLTSRPQSNIPILAGGTRCQFRPLSRTQAHSLVKRYDRFANLDVGERLIPQFRAVPETLLETPLLVALLYRTFGVNNSIADRITTFYSDTYEALFKGHDLTKAGFSRDKLCRLDIDRFREILQLLSFRAVVTNTLSWATEQELVDFVADALKSSSQGHDKPREVASDLLTTVPLVLQDGSEYRFIHKTFVEYFAAEFIARSPDSRTLLAKIYKSSIWQAVSEVARFVHDLSPQLSISTIVAPGARTMLGLGLVGQWSLEQTLSRGFKWWLRYGAENELGDFWTSSAAKADTLSAKGSIPGVLDDRHIEIGITVSPVVGLNRLPPFAWKLLTSEPRFLADVQNYALARLELSKTLSISYERGSNSRTRRTTDDAAARERGVQEILRCFGWLDVWRRQAL